MRVRLYEDDDLIIYSKSDKYHAENGEELNMGSDLIEIGLSFWLMGSRLLKDPEKFWNEAKIDMNKQFDEIRNYDKRP